MTGTAMATKLVGLHVLDKDYLMIQFRDGEVHYRDNGTGKSAYLGHSFAEGDDTLFVFGERLNTEKAQNADLWMITSKDDKNFKKLRPEVVWRKSKPIAPSRPKNFPNSKEVSASSASISAASHLKRGQSFC